MKQILDKIEELKKISAVKGDWDHFSEKMDKQEKLMEELTILARKHKTYLGRQIKWSVADGEAIYVVDKLNTNTVHISWIDYCDGYSQYPFYQKGGTIPNRDVELTIKFEEIFLNIPKNV